jgi:hypothetical protein
MAIALKIMCASLVHLRAFVAKSCPRPALADNRTVVLNNTEGTGVSARMRNRWSAESLMTVNIAPLSSPRGLQEIVFSRACCLSSGATLDSRSTITASPSMAGVMKASANLGVSSRLRHARSRAGKGARCKQEERASVGLSLGERTRKFDLKAVPFPWLILVTTQLSAR